MNILKIMFTSLTCMIIAGSCYSQALNQKDAEKVALEDSTGWVQHISAIELVTDIISDEPCWIVTEKNSNVTRVLTINANTGEILNRKKKMVCTVDRPSF